MQWWFRVHFWTRLKSKIVSPHLVKPSSSGNIQEGIVMTEARKILAWKILIGPRSFVIGPCKTAKRCVWEDLKGAILTIYITVFVTRGRHFGAQESVWSYFFEAKPRKNISKTRPWKDHFKSDLRSDQDHLLKRSYHCLFVCLYAARRGRVANFF
jgi:hypothetical protein